MRAAASVIARRVARAMVLGLAMMCGACATLSPAQSNHAAAIAAQARSHEVDCQRADACAQASQLHALAGKAFVDSTPQAPHHYALLLDSGQDALLARINLIRSATTTIDLQTYIFDQDDAGHLFIDELLAAARRGVRVRVLIDQLSALEEIGTLAALSGIHENFRLRIYNPTFGRAKPNYFHYALSVLCCFREFNQRMHNKLLLIDGAVAITGGRNYQNDYYDWDPNYNFRDRDVLIAGPAARAMGANFEAFWNDRRSVPAARLTDVGRRLLDHGVPALQHPSFGHPGRVAAASAAADDPALIQQRLLSRVIPVGPVHFIADLPDKHHPEAGPYGDTASPGLRRLIESARDEIILQTPYMILSGDAQKLFLELQQREQPPEVIVSTNSLAATDAFMVYALSHKYKRVYLREMGFTIYEFKPFPENAPIDLAATGAELPPDAGSENAGPGNAELERRVVHEQQIERGSVVRRLRTETRPSFFGTRAVTEPVPLKRAGVRIGLHAKSLVIDDAIGVVGTHNFDPRSDNYNTESAVVIPDPRFAAALEASIRRDIAPGNSWVVARRPKLPVLSGLDYSLGKISSMLPIFDLWPLRYASSYQYQPGPQCPHPLTPDDPAFRDCYESVGAFPQVDIGQKWLYTRILTAFGAGLAPIF